MSLISGLPAVAGDGYVWACLHDRLRLEKGGLHRSLLIELQLESGEKQIESERAYISLTRLNFLLNLISSSQAKMNSTSLYCITLGFLKSKDYL